MSRILQAEARNFIRMVSYENRMWSYSEGLHSFFVGKRNALNSFRRGDLTQIRKHIDFGNKFLTEIKNIGPYFNINKENIIRNMPLNLPWDLTPGQIEDWRRYLMVERMRLLAECIKKFPTDLDIPDSCKLLQNMPEGSPQDDLALCCFLLMMKELACKLIPMLRCYLEVARTMVALVRQKLLEAGCDCKISGPNPSGPACNYYCELIKKAEKRNKELQDKLEEAEKACKEMQQEFEEGGQYHYCLEIVNR